MRVAGQGVHISAQKTLNKDKARPITELSVSWRRAGNHRDSSPAAVDCRTFNEWLGQTEDDRAARLYSALSILHHFCMMNRPGRDSPTVEICHPVSRVERKRLILRSGLRQTQLRDSGMQKRRRGMLMLPVVTPWLRFGRPHFVYL